MQETELQSGVECIPALSEPKVEDLPLAYRGGVEPRFVLLGVVPNKRGCLLSSPLVGLSVAEVSELQTHPNLHSPV